MPMESAQEWHSARAALIWQLEMGADEAILDAPVNRYDAPKPAPVVATTAPIVVAAPAEDMVKIAAAMAAKAQSLDDLRDAITAYDHCDLKKGARNTVFADGMPKARVMVIGEAPGRDEDIEGRPFVGRAGQLLDKMLAAIDLSRSSPDTPSAVYITNILPWRPPQNRDPKPEEISMMMPFVQRHVELVDPDFVVLMGNISCQGILGQRGITRLRGTWAEAWGKPAMPMLHPAYLLRNPSAKREAWADLLDLKSKLLGT